MKVGPPYANSTSGIVGVPKMGVVTETARINDMGHFPNDTPHVIANRRAARNTDDKGSCYIVRPDQECVIVTVRSPGEQNESSVSIPLETFRKIVEPHL